MLIMIFRGTSVLFFFCEYGAKSSVTSQKCLKENCYNIRSVRSTIWAAVTLDTTATRAQCERGIMFPVLWRIVNSA